MGGLIIFVSFIVFVWAVVGLIAPAQAKLPNRVSSVGVWFLSVVLFTIGAALLPESPEPTPAETPPAVASTPPTVASTPSPEPAPAPAPPVTPPLPAPPEPEPPPQGPSDDEIRRLLVRQSIASYSGSCPCPYNTDRGGRRCGGRSAYSRPGGASPLCYPDDVSDAAVEAYRRRTQGR